jgi:hypothetical protein
MEEDEYITPPALPQHHLSWTNVMLLKFRNVLIKLEPGRSGEFNVSINSAFDTSIWTTQMLTIILSLVSLSPPEKMT